MKSSINFHWLFLSLDPAASQTYSEGLFTVLSPHPPITFDTVQPTVCCAMSVVFLLCLFPIQGIFVTIFSQCFGTKRQQILNIFCLPENSSCWLFLFFIFLCHFFRKYVFMAPLWTVNALFNHVLEDTSYVCHVMLSGKQF